MQINKIQTQNFSATIKDTKAILDSDNKEKASLLAS